MFLTLGSGGVPEGFCLLLDLDGLDVACMNELTGWFAAEAPQRVLRYICLTVMPHRAIPVASLKGKPPAVLRQPTW